MLEQLKERVNREIEELKKEWLEQSKEYLLDNAYKIAIITDFEYLPFDEMEEEQIETLLEQENVIGFLWDEWMNSNGFNTFDVLDDFFKYLINDRI